MEVRIIAGATVAVVVVLVVVIIMTVLFLRRYGVSLPTRNLNKIITFMFHDLIILFYFLYFQPEQ